MRRLLLLVTVLPLMSGCAQAPSSWPTESPVSASDASTTLQRVATLAAERTSESAAQVCSSLADSCDGFSGGFRTDPTLAPLSTPSILCDIALPAIPGQSGPRILVVTGQDASAREYFGQVLVLRRNGNPVVHEPAFWEGIRYTQLVSGRAWGVTPGTPSQRDAHQAAVRAACTDPAAFVAAITAGPGGPSHRPS